MARQPAFNQGDWQKKYWEKPLQQKNFRFCSKLDKSHKNWSHQQELNREVYERQAEPHNFHKNPWVWLRIEIFLNKN
jgi:hypothetical protein